MLKDLGKFIQPAVGKYMQILQRGPLYGTTRPSHVDHVRNQSKMTGPSDHGVQCDFPTLGRTSKRFGTLHENRPHGRTSRRSGTIRDLVKHPFVAVHHQLMRPPYEVNAVGVVEPDVQTCRVGVIRSLNQRRGLSLANC